MLTPKHILVLCSIILAAISYFGLPTLGVAVIILGASAFTP